MGAGHISDPGRDYGRISCNGVRELAHRYSWRYYNGVIPDGANVLHHCDNPRCVRPDHLFLGTQKDNIKDRDKKGRQRSPQGEQHGCSKLKEKDVAAIRATDGTLKEIAALFGICWQQVYHIKKRIHWRHI
jgi:hypothetical protein